MQEIEEIRTRIENFLSIAEADVRKNQEELYQPVQDKIRKAINAVGDEKGYLYVVSMEPSLFLYVGNSAINATEFVKAKLGIQ
jgi:outer membrane protein